MSLPFGAHVPFVDHLGLTLEKFEAGHSEMHYAPQPEHMNSLGVTHGGAVMTLLDVSMATAARSAQADSTVITIEMKTNFMRPCQVQPGQHLLAQGVLLHRTRSMAFTESRVYDPQGQLCAIATGTFKYISPRSTQAAAPG